ncbi:class II glutamine amidotransferase [Alysiella filiformis]|uniref:Glutamine amidotransferase n=1 Tax=Alysiella filiformis DSM 16848 TaxID=1120981 RepID=A0A286E5M9_9NEIS|nr:class II glutamine amidotransferase [Alysiella filiformis]QMT30358.1 class II glutamine amidotransferase [Alysiella filiformis]UBQ56665.1 class II glutamine amidotransferase [Alysiella filiformis DSM 16848]SOD66205.1 glutamine amidotransferase [Alysiella filiformis DSM 16848]
MCQLLGMNCNTPTDIGFSFVGFSKRGGLTDHHTDGFGIGFFEPKGKGLRLFLDNHPCATSPVAELVKNYPIRSENVIAHIRKATQGRTMLENTHPFQRELWGEYWLFAHNGNLKNFKPDFENACYKPVGNTDSETAFCFILNELRHNFPQKPSNEVLFATLTKLARHIRDFGMFNILISNGDFMFAHACTLLYYIERKAPFGQAHLVDEDIAIDFEKFTTPNDRVAVIATLPLTDNETWGQFAQDECVWFSQGTILWRDCPANPVYLSREEGLRIAREAGAAA